ncbi:MAG: DUF192 domain-containing protein [Phycisphaerales bacterium]|nr:DUF192 domain-containing protein [Phycisphaerales bacterium]
MKGARTVMIMTICCAAAALAITVATQDGGTAPGAKPKPEPPSATPPASPDPTPAEPQRERPGSRRHPTSGLPLEKVTIGDRNFDFEIAATDAAIQRGLGGRREIAQDGGMIFVFPFPSSHSFWMRDCLVDIDIAFLDRDGVVVAAYEMKAEPLQGETEPEAAYFARLARYPSGPKAHFAVETRAGTNKALGIAVGSRIAVDPARLLSLRRDVPRAPAR